MAGNPPSKTVETVAFGVRIPVELAERFEVIIGEEKRSAALRRLIELAVGHGAAEPPHERPYRAGSPVKRVVVSLNADEADRLAAAAAERSTTSAAWLRTLMRRRLGVAVRQNTDLRPLIRELTMEVRAVGRNVNQAVKALNVLLAEGRRDAITADLYRIVELAREMEGLKKYLRDIALGDYRYWTGVAA